MLYYLYFYSEIKMMLFLNLQHMIYKNARNDVHNYNPKKIYKDILKTSYSI